MEFLIQNNYGKFYIIKGNNFWCSGNIKAAKKEFEEIGRRPPNKYGNFFGREKAGNNACLEILKKYNYL